MNKQCWITRTGFLLAVLFVSAAAAGEKEAPSSRRPNIVVMLADDMGFGELQCLNPKRGKIKTPRLDAIAASGMTFTDAHSGSRGNQGRSSPSPSS